MTSDAQATWDRLIRRQFAIAALAAVVVLTAVAVLAWAAPDGNTAQPVLRMAPDGTRVVVATPAAEASRWAVLVAVAALVAVAGVLVVLLQHTVRVARALRRRPG